MSRVVRVALILAMAAFARPIAASETVLLVAVSVNGRGASEFEDVAVTETGALLVPVVAIVRAAEGLVDVADDGSVTLQLPPADGTIRIDARSERLQVNGRAREWAPETAMLVDGRPLVASGLIAEVFGLETTLSQDASTLEVVSARPLPADLRAMRERRWSTFGLDSREEPVAVAVETPYVMLAPPEGELQLGLSVNSGGDLGATASGRFEMEALRLGHRVSFSGDKDGGIGSLRWTSGRSSPTGGVFGVDRLSRAEIGDVEGLWAPLVRSGGQGRGLRLSSDVFERDSRFDVSQVAGDAPPGWDAELYLGSTLIDFQRVGPEGRFAFEDLPLFGGANDYRVVLYAPDGRTREISATRTIAAGALPAGEWRFDGVLLERGAPVFDLAGDGVDEGPSLQFAVDYGVDSALTLGAFGFFDLEAGAEGSEPTRHLGLLARSGLGPVTAQAGFALDSNGFSAAELATAVGLRSVGLHARYRRFDVGFDSPVKREAGGDALQSFRVGASTALGWLGSISAEYEWVDLVGGETEERIDASFRHRLGPISFSHVGELWRVGGADRVQFSSLASLSLFGANARLRAEGSMETSGDPRLDRLEAALTSRIGRDANLAVSSSYDLNSGAHATNGSLAWDTEFGSFGVAASLDDRGGWSANFGVGVSFGGDTRTGAWPVLRDRKETDRGMARLRLAGVDGTPFAGGDGESGAGASVALLVDGRPGSAPIDETGAAIISGLAPGRATLIELTGLDDADPFLALSPAAASVSPRPGVPAELSVAVAPGAMLSGRVIASTANGESGTAHATVVLERSDGTSRQTTRSLTGGYFLFENVFPGDWIVRVEDHEAGVPGLRSGLAVTLAPDEMRDDLVLVKTGGG